MMYLSSDESEDRKIGILAGWGRYPIVVAETLKAQGYQVYCLGLKGHADPRLIDLCDSFQWVGVTKLGQALRYFRRNGIRQATMAGKFHKVLMYQPWLWLKYLPDWTMIRAFYPYFLMTKKDRKDDTLLGAVVEVFAAQGITFGPATDYAPELLVKYGNLTKRGLSASQAKDVEFGWQLAKEMGGLDVGQSVIVKNRAVLAVEAIEGTDECIRRAGTLCPSGGFTIVKVAKPQQDMRFDVPTIGLGTLRTMIESGGRVLAVEASRTIILDEKDVADFANRHKLVIVAMIDGQCENLTDVA